MPKIIVCQNSKNYHVISFEKDISIGRDSDNGITLRSPQVSRKHGLIKKKGNNYSLLDLGSTNAIWRGQEKIHSLDLSHGTTFRIADFVLTFLHEGSITSQHLVLENDEDEDVDQVKENKTMLAVDFGQQQPDFTVEGYALLEAMDHFTHRIQSLENPGEDEILAESLSTSLHMTESNGGFIILKDAAGELIYRCTSHFNPDTDNKCVNHSTIRRVIAGGKTEIANCTSVCQGKKESHVLCAPLKKNGNTIGCYYTLKQSDPYLETAKILNELLLMMTSSLLPRDFGRVELPPAPSKERTTLEGRKDIIIQSQSMLSLYQDVQTIAPINVPTLVLGNPGTGKELVAAELHAASKRKGDFVTLNCSAIPEGIFESELFGAMKGAYQDAQDKPGKLELANNGTLFLDEIGDMSLQLQPKLLRFLENQEVTRLGDNRVRKLNVRVVAATNQDLQSMVEKKTFRPDLFQRLSCFTLKIPELKDREGDIEPLVFFFLEKFSKEYGWKIPTVVPKAMDILRQYSWPGNVRELRNAALRLAVHSQGKPITPDNLSRHFEGLETTSWKKVTRFPTLEQMEEKHIYAALKQTSWNISDASKLLGIARSTFYKKMQKYEISTDEQG